MSQLLLKYQRLSSLLLLVALFFSWFLPFTAKADQTDEGILNWFPRSMLTEEELTPLPSFCHGAYRIPDIVSFTDDRVEAEANHTEMRINGEARFSGEVFLQQYDRTVTGDEAIWNPNTGQGQFFGNVQLTNPMLVLKGNSAQIDDLTGVAEFQDAQYSIPSKHMRGEAGYIKAYEGSKLQLKQSYFTFCEPGHDDWDIATSTLNLNNETGMGSAWNTRLRINKLPVFYLPYYYFPLDDRRLTGFLDPNFSFTSKLQTKEFVLPFYINLHPQADATIAPHYVREHGTILETQFRHLTRTFGEGEFNYSVLEKDETLETKRWFLNYKHQGKFAKNWQHRWLYNQVSDDTFLNDASPMEATDRTTELPRRGEIFWNSGAWHFDVTAEAFQTVNENVHLKSRPYERLPQFNLNYTPVKINELQFQQKLQATRFSRRDERLKPLKPHELELSPRPERELEELFNLDSFNGDRLLSDSSLALPMQWPFAFATPKVEYRYRSYTLRDFNLAENIANNIELYDIPDDQPSIGSARYSLDAGLYFDREFNLFSSEYEQTFEPRIFYIYSPYVSGQHYIPDFDNSEITVTYNSLFMGERFTGGDRLADLNQVSLGATTRFIRDDGLEQLRFSLGQIFYFEDRRVQLKPDSTPNKLPVEPTVPSEPPTSTVPTYDTYLTNSSSVLAELELNPNPYWSFSSTAEWDPYKKFLRQTRYGLRFEDGNNHMLNLAYNEQRDWKYNPYKLKEETRAETAQLDIGVFWSLTDRWALYARTLIDVKNYEKAYTYFPDGDSNKAEKERPSEKKPIHPVLESIAGIEYQNCCWRVSLSYRESSLTARPFVSIPGEPDPDQIYSTEKDYGFMFTIQLKGLGTMGQKTETQLQEAIPGYSRRIYHDF